MKLHLISFPVCPYVQRSVILLNYKKASYDVSYIDLANKPDWFMAISPLGRVPVLKVNDEDVLFESAVIGEFVDEVTEPSLANDDPIAKAKERAWIEYASELTSLQFRALIAADKQSFDEQVDALVTGLLRVAEVSKGAFFRGEAFSLVDAAYAPIFMRMALVDSMETLFKAKARKQGVEHLITWYDNLLQQPYIQSSVKDNFEEAFTTFFTTKGGHYFTQQQAA